MSTAVGLEKESWLRKGHVLEVLEPEESTWSAELARTRRRNGGRSMRADTEVRVGSCQRSLSADCM